MCSDSPELIGELSSEAVQLVVTSLSDNLDALGTPGRRYRGGERFDQSRLRERRPGNLDAPEPSTPEPEYKRNRSS